MIFFIVIAFLQSQIFFFGSLSMTDVALQATNLAIELRKNQDSEMKKLYCRTNKHNNSKENIFHTFIEYLKKRPIYLSNLIWRITLKVLATMYINSFVHKGS